MRMWAPLEASLSLTPGEALGHESCHNVGFLRGKEASLLCFHVWSLTRGRGGWGGGVTSARTGGDAQEKGQERVTPCSSVTGLAPKSCRPEASTTDINCLPVLEAKPACLQGRSLPRVVRRDRAASSCISSPASLPHLCLCPSFSFL